MTRPPWESAKWTGAASVVSGARLSFFRGLRFSTLTHVSLALRRSLNLTASLSMTVPHACTSNVSISYQGDCPSVDASLIESSSEAGQKDSEP